MNLRSIGRHKKPTGSRFVEHYQQSLCCLALFFCSLFGGAVNAQELPQSSTLTLDQAIQLTLDQHPELGVFQHQREAYQGMVDQVSNRGRPTVELAVEDFGGSGDYNAFDSAQSTLSISWLTEKSLIDGRVQSARVAASQIDSQKKIKALDLSAQTAKLFIQALVEERRLALMDQATDQAKRTVATINKRINAGKSPEFERLQAEVELAQRELETEDLQHMLMASRYRLNAQWGDGNKNFRLVGELFKLPSIGDVEQQFTQLKQNPSLAYLATQQRIAQSEIELAKIESKPQWRFSVGVRRYEATDDFGLVAGFAVPLGEDRSNVGKIKTLQARSAEYQAESEALERQLDTQLYVLLQEINHSRHIIETLQVRIIPTLNNAQTQATQAYEAGKLGYQQWTEILNKKLGAQEDLLSAYEAIHLQHIELQRLTGTTLTF